jgi:tetratricopeptide (TPR) repeat protein
VNALSEAPKRLGGDPEENGRVFKEELRPHFNYVLGHGARTAQVERAARACKAVAERLWELGFYEETKEACNHAADLYEKLLSQESENLTWRTELAEAYCLKGKALLDRRLFRQAKEALQKAEECLKHPSVLDGPDGPAKLQLAEVYHLYAELGHEQRRELNEVIKNYWKAIDIRSRLLVRGEGEPGFHRRCVRDLARGYGYLGDTHLVRGELEKARDVYARSLVFREFLVEAYPGDREARWQLARARANFGPLEWCTEIVSKPPNWNASATAFRKSRDIHKELLDKDKDNALYRDGVGWTSLLLAETKLCGGLKTDKVPGLLAEVRMQYERLLKASPENPGYLLYLARAKVTLAWLAEDRDKALALLKEAKDHAETVKELGRDRPGNNPDLHYLLALVKAVDIKLKPDGDKKTREDEALDELKTAIGQGYTFAERLEHDPRFGVLNKDRVADMKGLVAKCKRQRQELAKD